MILDEIQKKAYKNAKYLDILIFGKPSIFHFLLLIISIVTAISSLGALLSMPNKSALIIFVLLLVFTIGNIATAQLIKIMMYGFEKANPFERKKWTRNLIYIPFTVAILLSLVALIFNHIPFANKIIIIIELYVWLIYYTHRKVILSFEEIENYYLYNKETSESNSIITIKKDDSKPQKKKKKISLYVKKFIKNILEIILWIIVFSIFINVLIKLKYLIKDYFF